MYRNSACKWHNSRDSVKGADELFIESLSQWFDVHEHCPPEFAWAETSSLAEAHRLHSAVMMEFMIKIIAIQDAWL